MSHVLQESQQNLQNEWFLSYFTPIKSNLNMLECLGGALQLGEKTAKTTVVALLYT